MELSIKDFAPEATDKISLDTGNGYYKFAFVSPEGFTTDQCLTMVSKNVDYKHISMRKTYKINDTEYVIGEEAEGGDIIANKSFDFHVAYSKLFLYKFLEDNNLLGKTKTKTLLLGLSLPDYSPENVLRIIKELKSFTVNGKKVEFKYVLVTVQGIGALKQYVASNNLEIPKKAMVIDIGTFTVIPLLYVNNEVVPTNAVYH